jgi:hypothetical protein
MWFEVTGQPSDSVRRHNFAYKRSWFRVEGPHGHWQKAGISCRAETEAGDVNVSLLVNLDREF